MERTIEVSKEWVAEALEKESELIPGHGWIMTIYEERKPCPVCAVGAVMRAALSPSTAGNRAIYKMAESNGLNGGLTAVGLSLESIEEIYGLASRSVEAEPMNALSFVFESLNELHRRQGLINEECYSAVQRDTIAFVREYFPATVRIYINGYEPAMDAGVKLVTEDNTNET